MTVTTQQTRVPLSPEMLENYSIEMSAVDYAIDEYLSKAIRTRADEFWQDLLKASNQKGAHG